MIPGLGEYDSLLSKYPTVTMADLDDETKQKIRDIWSNLVDFVLVHTEDKVFLDIDFFFNELLPSTNWNKLVAITNLICEKLGIKYAS